MNEYRYRRLEVGSMDLCRMKYILRKNEDIAVETTQIGAVLDTLTNFTAVIIACLKAPKRCIDSMRFTLVLDQVSFYNYNLEGVNDLLSDDKVHKS